MLARDCGVYANRNPAAHEVRDDEGSLWCAFGDFPRNGKVIPPAGAPLARRVTRLSAEPETPARVAGPTGRKPC